VHFTDSPLAKAAAGSCTLLTMCAPTDPSLSPEQVAAIAQAKQAVMRIQYVDGGSAFVCTATLVNTEKFPTPYILTANHCINNAQSAASITAYWFYEAVGCNAAPDLQPLQVPGGMQLVFSNYNVDETLLQANAPPPDGAIYAGLDASRLPTGAPIVSISHPKGDTTRYAIGSTVGQFRILGRP